MEFGLVVGWVGLWVQVQSFHFAMGWVGSVCWVGLVDEIGPTDNTAVITRGCSASVTVNVTCCQQNMRLLTIRLQYLAKQETTCLQMRQPLNCFIYREIVLVGRSIYTLTSLYVLLWLLIVRVQKKPKTDRSAGVMSLIKALRLVIRSVTGNLSVDRIRNAEVAENADCSLSPHCWI